MDNLVGQKLGQMSGKRPRHWRDGECLPCPRYCARPYRCGQGTGNRSLAEDPIAVQRFNREAVMAAKLQHPSIVAIDDVRQEGPYHYIAMRYVPGETLRDIISRDAPLTLQRAIQLLRPVAEALDYAHQMGIVHRDIKPGNIIVNPRNGEVVLTDFGIARAQDQSHLTAVGMVMGTADYLSPEQVRGEEATASSDNYALGIVADELLTGNPPFFDKAGSEALRAQLNQPPPPLSRFNPALPAGAQQVLHRALAKKPADRFATAVGIIEALNAVAQFAASRPAPPRACALMLPGLSAVPGAGQQPAKPPSAARTVAATPPAARRLPLPNASSNPPAPPTPASGSPSSSYCCSSARSSSTCSSLTTPPPTPIQVATLARTPQLPPQALAPTPALPVLTTAPISPQCVIIPPPTLTAISPSGFPPIGA